MDGGSGIPASAKSHGTDMKFCHKNNICILFIKKLKKKIFDLKFDFFFIFHFLMVSC